MKVSKQFFTYVLDFGVLIGRAIAKRPDLEKEIADVKESFRLARLPESHGGSRITVTEWAKEISPEILDIFRTLSPEFDALLDMFIKDEDEEDSEDDEDG